MTKHHNPCMELMDSECQAEVRSILINEITRRIEDTIVLFKQETPTCQCGTTRREVDIIIESVLAAWLAHRSVLTAIRSTELEMDDDAQEKIGRQMFVAVQRAVRSTLISHALPAPTYPDDLELN